MEAALEAKELGLTRGPKQLFSGLSFAVSRGHAVVLRGPNGVGKTSLLRVIAGLTEADAGGVLIGQQAVTALSVDARFSILYIGHANALKDDFTARENLADQLAVDANFATEAQQLDALKAVGLYERRRNRFGCWMSQPTRWTPTGAHCLCASWMRIWRQVASP